MSLPVDLPIHQSCESLYLFDMVFDMIIIECTLYGRGETVPSTGLPFHGAAKKLEHFDVGISDGLTRAGCVEAGLALGQIVQVVSYVLEARGKTLGDPFMVYTSL